ncbi:MAG: choice-of-anchor tandem repeat NxxGxxAF-containing protein [Phycisphaeraceae bacterium]
MPIRSSADLLCGALACAGLASAALAALPSQAQVSYETHALAGESAPGTDPGVVFSSFGYPVINSAGDVVFTANLAGPGVVSSTGPSNTQVINSIGVWSDAGGPLGLVARTGDNAPGTEPDVVFNGFDIPLLNSAGDIAFRGTVTFPGANASFNNREGIWSDTAGGPLDLIVRGGEAAPGTGPGVFFERILYPVFNNAGDIAFVGALTGPGLNPDPDVNDTGGIWSVSAGVTGLVARRADAAPGTGPGVVFTEFTNPVLGGAGTAAFRGSLGGPQGASVTNSRGIWSGAGGSVGLVTRLGDAAPGTGPGIVFSGIDNEVSINNAGDVAFLAFLEGPGVDITNGRGIWAGSQGTLQLVVRSGEPAPGTGPGVVFRNSFNSFSSIEFNSKGDTAFIAFLDGPGVNETNNTGVWSGSSGSLELIAREGDAAPGTETGVVFDRLVTPFSDSLALNGSGDVAFTGLLTGTGVDATNDYGIWATDRAGILQLIAREGDLFDVDDDPLVEDWRTIAAVDMLYGNDSNSDGGGPNSFNDRGQLAFRLAFTDGTSGIFVANVSQILPGDTDGDGDIDDADLATAFSNYTGPVGTLGGKTPADGDTDGDGDIDDADLANAISAYTGPLSPSNALPEPASLTLLGLGGLLAARRRESVSSTHRRARRVPGNL